MKTPTKLAFAGAICVAFLSGCGGGDSSPTSITTVATPALTGVFTDAPVAGLSYTTGGGYSGTTDGQGNFKYNTGETVTFKIGNLTLGTAIAGSTLSPLDLGAGNTTKVANLYVLLQSLDSDSSASTITLPTSLTAATLTGIDLLQSSEAFSSTSNAGLVAAQKSAGITTGIVTPAAAQAHAVSQFRQQTAGVWVLTQSGKSLPIVFRFDAAGGYLQGEAQGTTPGIELGTIAVDPLTAHFKGTVSLDTNGESGFSHPSAAELLQTMKLDGTGINVKNSDGSAAFRFERVANNPASIVGAWALNSTTSLKVQHFVFFADGHYMMLDPLGDTATSHPSCGGAGIEYGNYAMVTGGLQITGVSIDTNGCAGANEPSTASLFEGVHTIPTTFTDANTITISSDVVLKRVSQ